MADFPEASDTTIDRVTFLLNDLDTAMTFTEVAELTSVEKRARRSRAMARGAYETVLRLLLQISRRSAGQSGSQSPAGIGQPPEGWPTKQKAAAAEAGRAGMDLVPA